MRGREYYLIRQGKMFQVKLPAEYALQDVMLHWCKGTTYLLNREKCHLYIVTADLKLKPILIREDKGFNQISFALDRFILIGKQNKQHMLIDVVS